MKNEMIKDDNYVVIQGWMINQLKLSGNKLLIYAVINGFSQDDNSWFEGSATYLQGFINCKSKTTVFNTLNELVKDELIIKKEEIVNGVKLCKYKINDTLYKNCSTYTKNGHNNIVLDNNSILVCDNNIVYTSNIDNNKKKKIIKEKENTNEIEFELLWKLYPKKVGKADALKHYEKAIKQGTTFEEVHQGIIKYNEHILNSKTEYKYIKDGSTYFSKHSWEDEYKTKEQLDREYYESQGYTFI